METFCNIMTGPRLLVSDLDDTLLGDDRALRRFAEFYESQHGALKLVYATGRFFESVLRDVATTPLPPPEFVIGGVGSEVHEFHSGRVCRIWKEKNSNGWSAERIRDTLAAKRELIPQPDEFQSSFKVSYFFHNAKPEQLDELEAILAAEGILSTIVYSSSRDLDFLPLGVNKGSAAFHVARTMGFAPEDVIVAGNSENDLSLFQQGFRGIVVANAHDQLKQNISAANTYLSSHPFADGVCDGLEFWRG